MNEQVMELTRLIELEICIRQMMYAIGMSRRECVWHLMQALKAS